MSDTMPADFPTLVARFDAKCAELDELRSKLMAESHEKFQLQDALTALGVAAGHLRDAVWCFGHDNDFEKLERALSDFDAAGVTGKPQEEK